MSRCTPSRGVSLRSILPKVQILGASDIQCQSTHCSVDTLGRVDTLGGAESLREGEVLFIGLDDTQDFARMVIEGVSRGAKAIVSEQFLPSPIPQCIVPDVHEAYALASHAAADHPTRRTLMIGVVGTHGKTTASLITASMMKHVGNIVGYHSTLGGSNGSEVGLRCDSDSNAGELVDLISASVSNHCPAVVVELTDEMLCSRAVAGMEFDVLLFTSLRKSQRVDTLRARGIENGIERLIGQLKDHGVIVYNADDARLNRWIERHDPHAIGYGLDAACDVMGKRLERGPEQQRMMVQMGRSITPITTKILGDHNARHILGAAAIGYAFGLEVDEIVAGIERLQRIPGRLQSVPNPFRSIKIDLADQADRLAVSLHALQTQSGAPIVCVAEVPEAASPEQLMAYGRVLERAASKVILTQSRTTTQSGQRAIWQVLDGCEHPAAIEIVPNRETAIELAIRSSRPHDQLLFAGWGTNRWTNNQTDEVRSDAEVIEQVLQSLSTDRDPTPAAAAAGDRPVFKVFDAA